MTVDIRANLTCSLGVVISGSIGDDYLQNNGLIKTQGSCEISGLITPQVGQKVIFSYNKEGLTRNIPRVLRVLSYFADPFRNTTKVELGCKLTYLSDLREALSQTAFSGGESSDASLLGLTKDDQEIITIPISAASIMVQCLGKLGITASSYPLTNQFSTQEFDLSSGYVQVLSDLLLSESYFGYLDTNEILQIVSLASDDKPGPVLTTGDLIDVSPIGVGQLPGDSVNVSYSSLKLKKPDIRKTQTTDTLTEEEKTQKALEGRPVRVLPKFASGNLNFSFPSSPQNGPESISKSGPGGRLVDTPEDPEVRERRRINWELDEVEGEAQAYYVPYKKIVTPGQPPVSLVQGYGGSTYTTNYSTYGMISVENESTGENEEREVVVKRIAKNYGPAISIATPFAKAYLETGVSSFNNARIQTGGTNTLYEYYDGGNYTITTEEVFKTMAEQVCSLGIDLAYPLLDDSGNILGQSVIVGDYGLMQTELIIRKNWTQGGATKQSEARYKRLMDTSHGQQAIASLRENIADAEDAINVLDYALSGGLILAEYTVQTKTTGETVTGPKRKRENERGSSGTSGGSYLANLPAALEGRPSSASRNAEAYSKGGNAALDYGTSREASLELVSSSDTSERRTDFSMPYAPDDIFVRGPDLAQIQFSFDSSWSPQPWTWYDATLVDSVWRYFLNGVEYTFGFGGPGSTNRVRQVRNTGAAVVRYTSSPSDAMQKANTFGRVQNRLLLGNRSGISIQVAPDRMPAAPFDPLYIIAGSLSALYRTNGTQWAFDSQGIVCSTDALYWGVAGRTA